MPRDTAESAHAATALLSALLDSSDDAIVSTDVSGAIRIWSRGAERIFGYSADEMIGRSLSILMPGGTGAFTPLLERLRSGERLNRIEAVRIAKDGRLVHVSILGTAVRDPQGEVVGAAAIVRDITEQKHSEVQRQTTDARWRAIIHSAVDAIVVIDARGRIETFNRSAERMFGYTEAEVLGQSVNMLMPSPYRDEHNSYLARYLTTGVHKIIGIGREVTGLRRDGTTFPVHLSVGEWRVGTERHFTGILHDLTPRVKLEEQMREQTALARLGEMAAVIAHEVKNPLAAVRGAIQVIGGRLPAGSTDGPIVKEIVTRLDALNGLINDLLLFARAPRPVLAPVSLPPLIGRTVELLSTDPTFAGHAVTVAGDAPTIQADPELLKIVFQNLLINAAQASPAGIGIVVRLDADARACRVHVSDSGPGIPAEIRDKLFRPFVTTRARGTGLGLSIARRLVEAQGGSIAVDSPPEGGTVIAVTLPIHST
jgi:two-component system sensor kinase FixL